MFVKSSVSAGLLVAVANFAAGVSASPVLLKREMAAVGSKLLLTPAPSAPTSGSSMALTSQDSFIWTHEDQGIFANLTLKASNSFRLLNALHFQGAVESVDCTTEDITMKFASASDLRAAQAAWTWVNQAASNTIIYVAEGDACAGDSGRQPFSVESITYDAAANTALMAAAKARWRDFAEDASIHIAGTAAAAASGNGARAVSKDVSIDVSHDFSGPIYSTTVGGVDLGVSCSDCKTRGSLNADITLSLSDGFEASITTQNDFGATVEVSLTAGGSISSPISTSIPIASVALPGFSIAGVVDIGPQLTVVADATISSFSASATASVGAQASLPDGSGIVLGQSANIHPTISPVGLGVSGSVSAGAKVVPLITLDLAATFLGEGLVAGLVLQAPVLSATFDGAASTGGVSACGSSGTAQVSVEVDVGVELDAFGGFGSGSDQPNKVTVFSESETLYKACLSV
ncbi:hypothetical protein Trco_002410 [Trichoderma cornu-damae]|uniref:Uncharacterized protein n=1 Tax=Trichoderma cornu-damae TaxID=654480 RepID=A0A9P8TXT0_9HYPO|nr:hypothetical protein Trco_002410 [Trichoderma cornu-damae]